MLLFRLKASDKKTPVAPPGSELVAFTYSGDPATSDLDAVRFTVQDVNVAFPLLTDEEYSFLIDKWMPRYSSLTFVAAVAAATISRKFVGLVSVSADGVSVNTSELAQRYRDLAVALREEYKLEAIGGEIDLTNAQPGRFRMGLHDNLQAGLQDFGDFGLDTYSGYLAYEYLTLTGTFP